MSIKKDDSGRRWIEVEVEVPGKPEEVWEAIATGPGVSSWFVPCEKTEQEDGTVAVTSHFGPGMSVVATQTAYEPPHRFAAESSGLGPGAPKLATEWFVEARSGDVCVVRVVHSLFTDSDKWDNQLESVESGWPTFFRILRLYLQHFRGRYGAVVQLMSFASVSVSEGWESLTRAAGFSGAQPGERRTAPEDAPPLGGVVEWSEGSQSILRLDQPTIGLAHLYARSMGKQTMLWICFYLYGDQAVVVKERDEQAWQAWMMSNFPPAQS